MDKSKLEVEKPRIGKIYPGQHWIELHGAFNPAELRLIAIELEKEIKKINGNKNGHI